LHYKISEGDKAWLSKVSWFCTLTIKSFVLLTSTDWHQFSELCYPVEQPISVGLGDFKLFPLPSARGLCRHVPAVASKRRVGRFVGDQKWCLMLPSLIFYHNWNVLLHAINIHTAWDLQLSFPFNGKVIKRCN
jgi:hypothetical protein